MSKHNNNLSPSLSRRCYCGRYITIGEEKAGIGVFGYTCPDCLSRQNEIRFRNNQEKWNNDKQEANQNQTR